MRVAVAGGTGMVGRHVVAALRAAGHDPVALARSRGVDVTTGRGLDAALSAAEAVIDVTNAPAPSRRQAAAFFRTATEQLLDAGRRAGVGHHVVLSIVGVDRVGLGYYQAKLAQEQLVTSSGRPATVLRATQFHEFPGQILSRSRGRVALLPRMRIQPVAAREVAALLAEIAVDDPLGSGPEIGGPQVHELVDLARRVASEEARPRRVVPLPVLGKVARGLAGGGLLPGAGATLGTTTFDEWLAEQGR